MVVVTRWPERALTELVVGRRRDGPGPPAPWGRGIVRGRRRCRRRCWYRLGRRREVADRGRRHHAQALGVVDDALGRLEAGRLQPQLLLAHRRRLGARLEALDVQLALGQHDVKGDDAEEQRGESDTAEHDEAPRPPLAGRAVT